MSDKRASVTGGVRNLRAMFENKDESGSPPDRGRSPGGSIGGGSNGTLSPRPLSKVRTSFVTVESKSGQWGLRRDTSGEPSMAKRRTSFSIDEENHPVETKEQKESLAGEFEARKNKTVKETIPEAAIEADKKLGGPAQKESFPKADHNVNPSKSAEVGSKKPATSNGAANVQPKPKEAVTNPVEKAAPTKNKPAAISTNKTTPPPKSSPKSSPKFVKPTTPKPPKTPPSPRKSSLNRTPVKEPVKESSKTSLASTQTAKSTRPPSSDSASTAPPKLRIQPSPPKTGFVKPKPRSPTRPVKLPASLTAHTASSGSKTASAAASPPRQSLSRASGNIQHASAISRSPSRATGTKTLTRKPSTVNKTSSRPSLGPPPNTLKKQPSKQSLPHIAPADESFLARMMRPTTSSESKKAEKVPDTPPKRSQSVRRPMAKDGPPKMHEAPKHNAAAPKVVKAAAPVKTAEKDAVPKKAAEAPKATIIVEKPTSEPNAAVEEPEVEKPEISGEPTVKEPEVKEAEKAEEPVVEEAKVEEPKVDEVKIEEAVATEPKVEEPKIEEPKVEEPKIEEPKIEEPKIEEPKIEEPKIEEPKIEEPKVDAPKVEEPVIAPVEAEPKGKTEILEDPADIKAREEIARLNAELTGASLVPADQNEGFESY